MNAPFDSEELVRRFRRVPGEGPLGYTGPIDDRDTRDLPAATGTTVHDFTWRQRATTRLLRALGLR